MTDRIDRGWRRPAEFHFASQVVCTQAGGGKPRVCSASFQRGWHGFSVTLGADVTADIHQREDDTLRAIGRACVPAGLHFAKDILSFREKPECEARPLPSGDTRWTFEFYRSQYNGALGRRVRVEFHVITTDADNKPDIDRARIIAAGNALKSVAENLHGSLA